MTLAQHPHARTNRSRLFAVVLAVLFVLGWVDSALAWGPAVHVGLADSVLGNLGLLPAGVAVILRKHRAAYRYGCIAADFVFAKRWSRVKQFCHHWSTAFNLYETAETDRAKAFAFGYLSHLAADTIAHGKYVPRQIVVSGSTLTFGHLYWEMRADSTQSEDSWRRLSRLLRLDNDDHHGALRGHAQVTLLPHEWNLLLFYQLNAMAARPALRRAFGALGRSWGSELPKGVLASYLSESVDRILSVLSDGAQSAVIRDDPNGTSAFMQISVARRSVRRLRRRGLVEPRRLKESCLGFHPKARG